MFRYTLLTEQNFLIMKTIYIVRHAKSSWDDLSLSDHDRPLLPVGVKRTQRVAEYLKSKSIHPGLLLSSSAVRALETAKIIAAGIGYPPDKIKVEPRFYEASADTILTGLYALPDDLDSVMIFGHNPTVTVFVNLYLKRGIDNLPTSGVVAVRFKTGKWENIAGAHFKVNFVVFPKMLK